MWFSPWQRYISYFLVSAIFLILLVGCMDGSTNEDEMLSVPDEGNFHFQAFIESLPNEGKTDEEYERMQEITSYPSVREVSIHTETEETIEDYGHLIDEFPTYILVNHNGIVMNTSNIEEIDEYIESKQ